MQEFLQLFCDRIDSILNNLKKSKSQTVSKLEFKETIKSIFLDWNTSVKPKLENAKVLDNNKIKIIDNLINEVYSESRKRVSKKDIVLTQLNSISEIFLRDIIIPFKASKNFKVYSLKREDLLKRLNFTTKKFQVAYDYFEEAKSCFQFGFFRAATILAICALESCLKSDYYYMNNEEYSGKLFTLLNRYFTGDINRLPKQYEDFSKTHVKIRNSITHPEEFDFSEPIVFSVLCTVMELIKNIESQY